MAPALFFLAISTSDALGQSPFARPGALPEIDDLTQRAVIDSVTSVLDTAYVMTDIAPRMIDHLNSRWAPEPGVI